MKLVQPSPQLVAFRDALMATAKANVGELSALDILAMFAHCTGQLIALQDQRAITPAQAMQLVANNIEQGNREAIAELLGKTQGNG